MRLAAPHFADALKETGRRYDRVLVSSMLDVAAFRGMAPPWVRETPVLTYFHENQVAYPAQSEEVRDVHFGLTNFTTILASDSVAFNSAYNRSSLIEGLGPILNLARDIETRTFEQRIRMRSLILHPPVEFPLIDTAPETNDRDEVPVILWAHRWEYDKDPESFFRSMVSLDEDGVDFRLIVMGESFEKTPPIFAEARRRLHSRIIHWGYVENRDHYAALLKRADIAVSTSLHEFFGMGVIEAVRAGCIPCLPDRLSYPELFPREFLYTAEGLVDRITALLRKVRGRDRKFLKNLVEPYGWEAMAPRYRGWIEKAVVAD